MSSNEQDMGQQPSGEIRGIEAFNRFVLDHQHVAYSVAYRFLGSREAAEDAVQESFLRAYRARAHFHGGSARAWLLRIVANVARDELRRRRRRPAQSLDAARTGSDEPPAEPRDPDPTPDQLVLQADLRASLERALAELPDDFRLVVLLRDVHGLSYEEVAEATGLPMGTVRSRLSRARGRLREVLRPDGELRREAAPRRDGTSSHRRRQETHAHASVVRA